jgi:hypothetical protein
MGFADREYPQNFHHATHGALFHTHHPLIAFVHERRSWYTDEFADTSALTTAEREQIRHWRPNTVGEVLFDSWD